MAIFIHNACSYISSYVLALNKPKYAALQQKDEDYYLNQARKWISDSPVPSLKDIRSLNDVDKVAKRIISHLFKDVVVNQSNVQLVESHLIELARADDVLRTRLIKYLSTRAKAHPHFEAITTKLIFQNYLLDPKGR